MKKTWIELVHDELYPEEFPLREQEMEASANALIERLQRDAEELRARQAGAGWRERFYSGFVRCAICRKRRSGLLWAHGEDGEEETVCPACAAEGRIA